METTPKAAKKTKTPKPGLRWTILVFNWIIVAFVIAQVLSIGMGLLYRSPAFLDAHIGAGWMVAHGPGGLLLLVGFVLGFFAPVGRNLLILMGVNLVLLLVTPVLATFRTEPGAVAAVSGFHPLIALAVFTIAFYTSLKLWALIKAPRKMPLDGARLAPQPTQTQSSQPASAVVGRFAPPTGR